MTLLWSIYVLTSCFTPLACVLLRTWEYTLIYTANVFYPRCTISFHLRGKCCVAARYNIMSFASRQSARLYVKAWGPSSLGYATFRSSLLSRDLRHTSCRNTMYFVFACAGSTGDSAFFIFRRPVLRMFYFQSTELRRSWTWSASWNATSCHIFLMRLYNQFANEKLTKNVVRHFASTRLVDKKCV
jgi:hypothetical protein